MKPVHLLSLATALIVAPALAQVIQVQPIQRPAEISPMVVQPVQQDSDLKVETMTIEEARALIGKLRREKREVDAKLTQALADLEQMTSRGGSLVRAYCESPALSRNTAGASENCAATGYVCGEVDGLCKKQCTTSNDCSGGFTCDVPAARCVRTG